MPYNPSVNKYATGAKRYGAGLRSAPNVGAVSASGRTGYAERDLRAKARRDAMVARLKSGPKRIF